MKKPTVSNISGKTTLIDRRVPKEKNRTGLTSSGNVGTGGNLNTTKKPARRGKTPI